MINVRDSELGCVEFCITTVKFHVTSVGFQVTIGIISCHFCRMPPILRNSGSVLQNSMSICKIVWANLNSVEYTEYVLKETEPKCEVAFEHEGNVLFTVRCTHEFIKLWKGQAPRTNNSCSKATEHFEWFCFLGTPFKNKMQNSSFASFWDFPFFSF